jgi:hypothetical protein
MTQDGVAALTAQLRGTPPAGVARLSDGDLHHLASAVQTARRRQAAELDAAGQQALSRIPRLLRGPIRKVIS